MKALFGIALVTLVVYFFSSCAQPDKAWRERLVNIDSVAINFFAGNGSMDSVVGVTVVRDAATIDSIRQWITAEQAKPSNEPCGPQASMHFFGMGKVMHDAEWGIASCGLVQYRWQGQTQYTRPPIAFQRWMDDQRKRLQR